ncbi:hypothetical protein [Bradyrhizobium phage BDU-MI-1]|nr:hypothetical protein [Bradyrhizobium phage BDU-MI-1]
MYGKFRSKGHFAAWMAHERRQQRRRDGGNVLPPSVIELLNARFVAEGDSITAGSNGPSWTWAFVSRTRGRFFLPTGYNQGTGGQTAAQMKTQIAAVTALSPKVVSLLAGTNDLSGTSNTPATIYADLKACWKGYIDGGADYVIAIKVLPRNDTAWNALSAARRNDRVILNGLIANLATDPELAGYASKIRIVDLESGINPETDMGDKLHPNWVGAIKLGNAIGDVANTLIVSATLNDLYLDSSNMLLAAKNPALNGTAGSRTGALNTGQVADGWKLDENGGMTVVASKTALNGANAQRVQVSGTNSTANRIVNFNAVVSGLTTAIGDKFEACVDFSLAAGATNLRNIVVNHSTASTPNGGNQTVTMDGAGAVSGTLRTTVSAPLGATVTTITLQCLMQFDAGTVAADITWGRPYLRKVPAIL